MIITVKKNYFNIDVLKCIAMFMVISLHSGLWHTDFISNRTIATLIQYCFRLIMEGVPIFVFINGFLILGKENVDIKKHYIKTLKMFILFVLWAIINYTIISLIENGSVELKEIISSVTSTQIGSTYTGHLWFLQNLIALYFIYPIINNVYNSKTYNTFFLIVIFFAYFPTFIDMVLPGNSISIFINRFCPISNLIFIFYFMLGGLIKCNINWFKKNRNLIIIIAIIMYILSCVFGIILSYRNGIVYKDNYLYSQISLSFIITGFFITSFKIKNNNKKCDKIVSDIGKSTLGIFLLHPIVISLLLHIFNGINNEGFFIRLLFSILVFIISYIVVFIIKKIPLVRNIVKL